jgi:hypothetical protein
MIVMEDVIENPCRNPACKSGYPRRRRGLCVRCVVAANSGDETAWPHTLPALSPEELFAGEPAMNMIAAKPVVEHLVRQGVPHEAALEAVADLLRDHPRLSAEGLMERACAAFKVEPLIVLEAVPKGHKQRVEFFRLHPERKPKYGRPAKKPEISSPDDEEPDELDEELSADEAAAEELPEIANQEPTPAATPAATPAHVENLMEGDKCRVPGCTMPVLSRGVCSGCRQYAAKHPDNERGRAIAAAMLPSKTNGKGRDSDAVLGAGPARASKPAPTAAVTSEPDAPQIIQILRDCAQIGICRQDDHWLVLNYKKDLVLRINVAGIVIGKGTINWKAQSA